MDRRPLIVIAEALSDAAVDRLRSAGDARVLPDARHETLIAALSDADALVVRSYAQVTAQVIAAGPRLKVIGRAGVGLDNIDVDAARERGVQVVYTPAAATRAVAEHTIALILALERHLVAGDAMVRGRRFLEARGSFVSRELRGLTLGIVGMGRIGREVGCIGHDGFGMRIIYNDIRDVGPLPFPARSLAKDDLYRVSDIVTVHVPLTELTRHLIDAAALRCMKPQTTLINTARGAVIDAAALADSLRTGRLAGAAVDTHDPEPPPDTYPLFDAPNCLLSAHVAARTHAGLAAMNDVVDDVLAVLQNRSPTYPAW